MVDEKADKRIDTLPKYVFILIFVGAPDHLKHYTGIADQQFILFLLAFLTDLLLSDLSYQSPQVVRQTLGNAFFEQHRHHREQMLAIILFAFQVLEAEKLVDETGQLTLRGGLPG